MTLSTGSGFVDLSLLRLKVQGLRFRFGGSGFRFYISMKALAQVGFCYSRPRFSQKRESFSNSHRCVMQMAGNILTGFKPVLVGR